MLLDALATVRQETIEVELSLLHSSIRLGVCTVGIYVCYIAYGALQETLYKPQDDGSFLSATAFILLVQCLFNAAVSLAIDLFYTPFLPNDGNGSANGNIDPINRRAGGYGWLRMLLCQDVIVTSFVYVLAMYTSNEALRYVSYPTQALAKSYKMIPVFIGRTLISGERYSVTKYHLCALLMTFGIALFRFLGKKKMAAEGVGGEDFGVLLLAFSLTLDGVSGPFQEKLKALRLTNTQQIVVNNLWASALMFFVSMLLGQLWESIAYIAEHVAVAQTLLLFSLCSAVGQLFIFYTIRTFDSLTLSTITTTRKFITIVISVVVHGNVLALNQWGAFALVFAGLAVEVWNSGRERIRKILFILHDIDLAVDPSITNSPVSGSRTEVV